MERHALRIFFQIVVVVLAVLSALNAFAQGGNPAAAAGAASNAFGLDLYAKLPQKTGNLVFSPCGLSCTLAMAFMGARNETASEMARIMHTPGGPETADLSFAQLMLTMGAKVSTQCEVSLANALWVQKDYPILPDFVSLVNTYYRAPAEPLDFTGAPAEACQRVTHWVLDKTKGRISGILDENALHPATRLVITNAVYFKSPWRQPFFETGTKPMDFQTAPGKVVQAPLMHQTQNFLYAETQDVQVLQMPYLGFDMAMVVILPRQMDGLAAFERTLSLKRIVDLSLMLQSMEVEVFFPRFRMECGFDLASTLKTMGMTRAFDLRSADFSGVSGAKDLFIDVVIHKTFIDVNEKGTEAAAASGIGIPMSALPSEPPPPPPVFKADHPFLFYIMDNQTGTILFLGRCMQPETVQ